MVSLGCPKNQVDAEMMLYKIKDGGFELTNEAGSADAVVINTCGFIESAKQEAIDNILEFCELKKEGRIKSVIVTGCLAERYQDEILSEIPEVDAVVGIGANSDICGIITKTLNEKKSFSVYDKKDMLPLNGERIISTLPFYAYIKIAEGCSNCCTYCAIPSIRGKFRSREMQDILSEAENLAKRGVKELVVVAQDTTRYGEDIYGEPYLAKLLRKLCEIDGFKWIRVLYCYPDRITDELIETIADEPKICKYIDIPLQHADAAVLKAMNRTGSRAELAALMNKIRSRIPGVILRTTFIAGFPGETQRQFEELCEFASEIGFERMGCFPYSAEEGTAAAKLDGQIDEAERTRRAEILMEQQMFIMDKNNNKLIGAEVEAVVEGFDRYGDIYFGRTAADAPDIDGKIFFSSEKPLKTGDFVSVKVSEVLDYDLVGIVI